MTVCKQSYIALFLDVCMLMALIREKGAWTLEVMEDCSYRKSYISKAGGRGLESIK